MGKSGSKLQGESLAQFRRLHEQQHNRGPEDPPAAPKPRPKPESSSDQETPSTASSPASSSPSLTMYTDVSFRIPVTNAVFPVKDKSDLRKQLIRGFSQDQMPSVEAQLENILGSEEMFSGFMLDMFDRELDLTDDMQMFLRGNCLASRIISNFYRAFGMPYLKSLIAPHILATIPGALGPVASTSRGCLPTRRQLKKESRLAATAAASYDEASKAQETKLQNLNFEIDPTRLSAEELKDIETNRNNVITLTRRITDAILTSSRIFPPHLLLMNCCLRRVLYELYPTTEACNTAIATVIFLRFINPAIVTPQESGLIDMAPPTNTRRGLLLASKIIQNLANNVRFSKEEHMIQFNDFLEANSAKMQRWVYEVSNEHKKAVPKLVARASSYV